MEGDGGRTYHGMAVGTAERKKENKEDNVYSQPITHKYIQTMTKVTLLDPTNTKGQSTGQFKSAGSISACIEFPPYSCLPAPHPFHFRVL
ncbi:hypothetical protein NC651_026691 [Populus alba x Populus x berolinensis]|nr:hypothetical protein NC651_026691 [Populus alba x Populus x berolinensis]